MYRLIINVGDEDAINVDFALEELDFDEMDEMMTRDEALANPDRVAHVKVMHGNTPFRTVLEDDVRHWILVKGDKMLAGGGIYDLEYIESLGFVV